MLERDIERKLVRWSKTKNILTYKFSSPAHRGVPDRIFIANGVTLFLELKAEGKKPTKLQLNEISKINAAGSLSDWAAGFEPAKEKILKHLKLES